MNYYDTPYKWSKSYLSPARSRCAGDTRWGAMMVMQSLITTYTALAPSCPTPLQRPGTVHALHGWTRPSAVNIRSVFFLLASVPFVAALLYSVGWNSLFIVSLHKKLYSSPVITNQRLPICCYLAAYSTTSTVYAPTWHKFLSTDR